jgi:hypothetical protein
MDISQLTPWLMTAEHLYRVKQEIKRLELQEKQLSEELKVLSENKTKAEGNFVYLKEMRAGSIEYSAIDLLREVNLELFRKPSVESWKLIKVAE